MIGLPPAVRIFVATQPSDMRRSFDGLAALTRDFLGEDPLSGHLFCFRNKRGDRVKVLYWDRSGLCVWAKRLEKGVFCFPQAEGARVEIEAADLMLILEGIDLAGAERRPRIDLSLPFSQRK
jgi:transposase